MIFKVNDAIIASADNGTEDEQLLFDSTSHTDRYQFEQLKRDHCYVARTSALAQRTLSDESRYKFERRWTTNDGRSLMLLHERYQVAEPLFAPSIIGGAEMHWLDETGTSTERVCLCVSGS